MSQPAAATSCVPASNETNDAVAILRHLAHELRQPLSAIEAIAYCLGINLPSNLVRAREHVGRLRQAIEQANIIIADAVFFVDRPAPRTALLDLSELVSQTLAQAATDTPETKLRLSASVFANLDVDYTRHLIRSLFAICRQVAHPDGQLTISTHSSNREVYLAFLAEGPSVQPDLLQNLFEPLNQSMAEGPGLSLTNVRRIVEAHGGRIAASAGAHTVSVVVTFPAA